MRIQLLPGKHVDMAFFENTRVKVVERDDENGSVLDVTSKKHAQKLVDMGWAKVLTATETSSDKDKE
jgi:hypothetical protein